MVTNQQVRRLFKLMQQEPTLATAADKAGMDEKTARKYRRLGKLPSDVREPHTWRTRQDPFADVWPEIQAKLKRNPGLQAKTLFLDLQHRYPERFKEGRIGDYVRYWRRWVTGGLGARKLDVATRLENYRVFRLASVFVPHEPGPQRL